MDQDSIEATQDNTEFTLPSSMQEKLQQVMGSIQMTEVTEEVVHLPWEEIGSTQTEKSEDGKSEDGKSEDDSFQDILLKHSKAKSKNLGLEFDLKDKIRHYTQDEVTPPTEPDKTEDDFLAKMINDQSETIAPTTEHYVDQEVEVTDDLASFLSSIDNPVDLLPKFDEGQEEQEFPHLFVERITPMELKLYKSEKILLEKDVETAGSIQLYLKLPDEEIRLGRVIPSLRVFLLIKRLCSTRQLFIAIDENTNAELTEADLDLFLLEEIQ